MTNAHFLITRQQYDEAIAKLPDVRRFKGNSIEAPVDLQSLLTVLNVEPSAPGVESWMMSVAFEKVHPNPGSIGAMAVAEPCWRLVSYYRIV